MDKQQFLAELKQLLGDIPATERDEALGYYEDYFEDAGEENEATVLKELESPDKIAFMIKAGLKDSDKSIGEFTETGFSGYGPDYKDEVANTIPGSDDRGFTTRRNGSGLPLIIVILLIISIPIWFPILIGLAAALLGIAIAAAAVVFSVAIAGIASIVAGIIILIVGIPGFFVSGAGGLFITGIGLAAIGAGILLAVIGIAIVTMFIPAIFKIIVKLFQGALQKVRLTDKGGVTA